MKRRTLAFVIPSSAVVVLSFVVGCDLRKSPAAPTCTFSIQPATATLGTAGGTGTVTVTTATGCAWTATAAVPWITVTGGATGTGPGTVTYTVGANAETTTRSAALTIAGQNHAITQQGRSATPCSYELSPPGADFTKDGGGGTFAVLAPADCAWTATSSGAWITIEGSRQGSGAGAVSYTVPRQTGASGRTGGIAVADRSFTIRQSGDAGVCQYSVAPVRFTPCMSAGTAAATITTEAACPWTATATVPWLTVGSGSSGSGTGAISIAFSSNYDAPRDGVIMVRWPTVTEGQNIQVAQAGCRYAVSRTVIDVVAAGGTGTFDVIQQSDPLTCGGATQNGCVWTARSDVPWITITSSMPRSGDDRVAFAVAPNDVAGARSATIRVADKAVTVAQAGR